MQQVHSPREFFRYQPGAGAGASEHGHLRGQGAQVLGTDGAKMGVMPQQHGRRGEGQATERKTVRAGLWQGGSLGSSRREKPGR